MSQVSQECCICYRTAIDQYITPCGHFGCIQCFLGRGINLINNSPEPHCPVCHLPVLWLAPCKTLNTASQENLSEAAARAEPSFHPPPCAGGVFLHHVSICDQCAAQHPNPYDEAVLTVPLERRAGLHAVEVMRRGMMRTAKKEAKRSADQKFKAQLQLTLACFSDQKTQDEKKIFDSVLEDFAALEVNLEQAIAKAFTSTSQATVRNVVTQPLSTFKNKLQAKITQLENAITTL